MDWEREESIPELKNKTIEDAFYEVDGIESRIVLIIDGEKHVFEAYATGYGGECSVAYGIDSK